jgi:hypothetical protein
MLRLTPAPGAPPLPPSVWGDSFNVAVEGATADASETRAFREAWSWPKGDPADLLHAHGPAAAVVGLPYKLVTGAAFLGDDLALQWRRTADFDRFDRVVASRLGDDLVLAGVMPEGTTRGVAECALRPLVPCAPADRLLAGGVVAHGSGYAQLAVIEGRWVVVVASKKARLPVRLIVSRGGPWTAHASIGEWKLPAAWNVPASLVGSVTHGAGDVVFRFVGS